MSVKKTKVKLSLWPVTKDTDNAVNQSKLEADTCSTSLTRIVDFPGFCERGLVGQDSIT